MQFAALIRVHQVTSSECNWLRVIKNPYHSTGKGSTRTGVGLNSGSLEMLSTTGLTSAPTRACDAWQSFQCIGTNTVPRAIWPLLLTRTTIEPHRVVTLASSPSRVAVINASCG